MVIENKDYGMVSLFSIAIESKIQENVYISILIDTFIAYGYN